MGICQRRYPAIPGAESVRGNPLHQEGLVVPAFKRPPQGPGSRRIEDMLEEENKYEDSHIFSDKKYMLDPFHKDDWHREMVSDTDLGCFGMEFRK